MPASTWPMPARKNADPEFQVAGATRPFIVERLKPIQQPSTELDDYVAARAAFTRDEWMDVLLRTLGLEPSHPDFSLRKQIIFFSDPVNAAFRAMGLE